MDGLSDRAKALIPKARIMGFDSWTGLSDEAIARLRAADEDRVFLSDADLAMLEKDRHSPDPAMLASGVSATQVVTQLRAEAADIVDEARAVVLTAFPGILEPGGGLYPATRAEACWRDFWQFLRCITYGIAGGQHHYTSTVGLEAMEQLYQELKVPLPAMVAGLIGVKKASLRRFPAATHAAIAPYFDHLIARLSTFVKESAVEAR